MATLPRRGSSSSSGPDLRRAKGELPREEPLRRSEVSPSKASSEKSSSLTPLLPHRERPSVSSKSPPLPRFADAMPLEKSSSSKGAPSFRPPLFRRELLPGRADAPSAEKPLSEGAFSRFAPLSSKSAAPFRFLPRAAGSVSRPMLSSSSMPLVDLPRRASPFASKRSLSRRAPAGMARGFRPLAKGSSMAA